MDSAKSFLVLSRDGEIRFAAPHPPDDAVVQALWREWSEHPVDGRMLQIQLGGTSFSAVVAAASQAVAFIVMPHAGRDALLELVASVDFAADILRLFLTNPYEAISVVDRDGLLRYLSPVHEQGLNFGPGQGRGRHITEIVENSRLHEVARSGKAEAGVLHTTQGATRIVSRMPVRNLQGEVVGAVGNIMFKGPEQLTALSAEVTKLREQVQHYRKEISSLRARRTGLDQIIGESAAIRQLKAQIARVAPLNVPVLLAGESGTGKELAAHAIHQLSQRREESMVMINAAAMPATLVESELFGYEAGAFTGAERKGRRGKFEQADKGTLFLDEIGDMPLEIQVKLLRVLQDGSFERVGGDKSRQSDFRLVCASNRDFEKMIATGEFRLDLFYRMSGVTLRIPALRDRVDDIELLAEHALSEFALRNSTRRKKFDAGVLDFLRALPWPGNVRQLMHAMESAAIFSDSDRLTVEDFTVQGLSGEPAPPPVREPTAPAPAPAPAQARAPTPAGEVQVRQAFQAVEENLIREAMARHRGNKLRVAAELGISRTYLYKRLSETGLDWTRRPQDAAPAASAPASPDKLPGR